MHIPEKAIGGGGNRTRVPRCFVRMLLRA